MIERRHFPRYTFELEFRVVNQSDQDFRVRANDISEAGISLAITQSVINGLADQGIGLEISNKFQIIPVNEYENMQPGVFIECQVMHIRRLSQEHYLIGAWFNATSSSQQEQINLLLKNARHTNED